MRDTCAEVQASGKITSVSNRYPQAATPLLDANAFRQCMAMFKQSRFVQVGYFGLLPTITPDLPQLLGELRAAAPKIQIALDTVNPPAAAELLWPILRHVQIFAPSRTEAVDGSR